MKTCAAPFVLLLLVACASTQESTEAPAAEPASEPTAAAAEPAPEAPAKKAPSLPPEDLSLFVGYAAFNDHDFDKAVEMFAEDAVWQSSSRPGQPFEGRDGVLQAFKAWEPLDPAAGARRLFVLADDLMVVEGVVAGKQLGEYRGTKPSKKPYGQAYAHVIRFDDESQVKRVDAVSNGLAVPVQIGAAKAPVPIERVPLPLGDTEMVIGEGDAARVAAWQKVLDDWHAGNAVSLDGVLADEVVFRSRYLGTETTDRAKIMETEKRTLAAFTGGSSDFTLHAVGDYVVGYGTHTAKHTGDFGRFKKSGKDVTWHEVIVLKFDGDNVVEVDRYIDPVELQLQLKP